jgi:Fe-S-cluster containining protein
MITNDECIKCGACCAYFFDEDLWEETGRRGVGMFIADDEVSQIPPSTRRSLVVEHPVGCSFDRWLRGRKVGDRYQCKALDGEIGNCKCSIYKNRPETCREFELGGEKCLKARAALACQARKWRAKQKVNSAAKIKRDGT